MSPQLPLALAMRPGLVLEQFVAGPNAQLLAELQALLAGGQRHQIFIGGGPASGKTHLLVGACAAWEQRAAASGPGNRAVYVSLRAYADYEPELLEGLERHGLIALDDLQAVGGDDRWERALFGLYDRARANGCRLLLAANQGPAALPIRLADLRSRLAWGLSFQLRPLADADKLELLRGQAERRGLQLPEEVARYILDRHDRDLPALLALLERLDRASLAEQRPLTVPFVRRHLAPAGD